MKKLGAIIFTAFLTTSSLGGAEEIETRYLVEGDSQAVPVCRSIVNDQPVKLRNALRRSADIYYGKKLSPQYFSCNGENLRQFSLAMDARNCITYLDKIWKGRGSVTMEEVATR